MRFNVFQSHIPFFLTSTLISSFFAPTRVSALRILVQPETTIGAATTVYWVREPTDPTPLFDLRFVVHGEGRDVGLAGANIDFTDYSAGASDGVRSIGRETVQFPRAGNYVLVAVSGPNNQQIGTSNRVVVTAAPPTATSATSGAPTSTNSAPSPSPARQTRNNTPVIVGALVGAILFIAIVALLILFLIKRRRIRQEQDRLSFHPEQMVQRRTSRWMSISRFSVSRGGGARAVDADRAEVIAEAGGVVGGEGAVNPFGDNARVDVEAHAGNSAPEIRGSDPDEVVFDVDHHRKSAASSHRTSLNSFSTESRSRYSGDIEAVQGAGGLAKISGLLAVPTSNSTLVIPPAPSSAPPRVAPQTATAPAVRALPSIPLGPAFDEDTMSSVTQSRKSSTVTFETRSSGLRVEVPSTPRPPPTTEAHSTTAPAPTPTTARPVRPLPSPAVHVSSPATPTLRSLPPLPVTPASALPFRVPATPETATIVFPTPTYPAPTPSRTPRQQLIDRRLSQVRSQLKLLRKKLARDQIDGEVGARVERDLEKQLGWLERVREGSWARDMDGSDDTKPEGWSRYMTP